MILSPSEKSSLITVAYCAIEERHGIHGRRSSFIPGDLPESIRCGVFVSVYSGKELKGCIGTFCEDELLTKNTEQMAISAAFLDSRFGSLSEQQLSEMTIEISVLSPRERIQDPSQIELGKHGIIIEKGSCRGTFLPQVAIRQGWNREEFLGNCSKYKAGIGWDGWRTAEIYTYEASVFSSVDYPPLS